MPTITDDRSTHGALLEFADWVEFGMKPSVQNVLELKKINPSGLKNPVLLFVVPRAMSYIVERFVVEIVQAWELLNSELKKQQLRTLGISSKDYRHLKRIRNKLVAHKIENSLVSNRHEIWYDKTYGNFESVLALLVRVAERIACKIRRLEATGKLCAKSISIKSVVGFTIADIEDLLTAVKAYGIY